VVATIQLKYYELKLRNLVIYFHLRAVYLTTAVWRIRHVAMFIYYEYMKVYKIPNLWLCLWSISVQKKC